MGQDQDDVILAPYTTVLKRLSRFPFLRQILVSATSPNTMMLAQKQITELLRLRHNLFPMMQMTSRSAIKLILPPLATATTEILTILLASIASVSLLVGGIGIMNIMLVSVTERTRARSVSACQIGARGKDILTQFLHRSACSQFAGWNYWYSAWSDRINDYLETCPVANGLLRCSLLYYPSDSLLLSASSSAITRRGKAAMLNPIDALRYE